MATVEIPAELPARERYQWPGWTVALRSEIGAVRTRLEDAWAVLPEARHAGAPVRTIAVFDGLGGHPNGQEAAWAAAEHLADALAGASTSERVLPRLNDWVRQTGGATTALVALLPPHPGPGTGTLLSVGDSGAWRLGAAGEPELLAPKDHEGLAVVTDYLGNPDLGGHARPFELPPGGTLLLCTDGADEVVEAAHLRAVLEAPDLAAALDDLFAEIHARGAPDNATVVAARRTA